MNTYSQNQEDLKVAQFFSGKTGTLLELGANDGKTLSNSLALIENGWSAILLEPSPSVFPELEKRHIANIYVECINIAITEENGTFLLQDSGPHIKGGSDLALVSTFKKSETTKWRQSGVKFKSVPVDGLTWKTFIQRYDVAQLDFISIDCEGMDLQILSEIDFDLHKTTCICVEWNGKDEASFTRVVSKYGFSLLDKNPENLIFVR
jgi:FkbM family methyltransferase